MCSTCSVCYLSVKLQGVWPACSGAVQDWPAAERVDQPQRARRSTRWSQVSEHQSRPARTTCGRCQRPVHPPVWPTHAALSWHHVPSRYTCQVSRTVSRWVVHLSGEFFTGQVSSSPARWVVHYPGEFFTGRVSYNTGHMNSAYLTSSNHLLHFTVLLWVHTCDTLWLPQHHRQYFFRFNGWLHLVLFSAYSRLECLEVSGSGFLYRQDAFYVIQSTTFALTASKFY